MRYGAKHQDKIFPKISKCSFYRQAQSIHIISNLIADTLRYGPSGTLMELDAMCLLPLNILNEKIFFVLYFWYATPNHYIMRVLYRLVFIITGTALASLYYFVHWFSPTLRRKHLEHHLKVVLKLTKLSKKIS